MKNFLVVFLLLVSLSSVTGLLCWLCAGGSGSSFVDCNTKKTVQNCSEDKYQEPGKGPLDRCSYFSYFPFKTGKRLYGKSCTFVSYCKSGAEFCKHIPGGATQCQVECCPGNQCNDQDKFKDVKNWTTSTYPPQPADKYWCDWKETNTGCMVSGILAVVACAMAVVFLH